MIDNSEHFNNAVYFDTLGCAKNVCDSQAMEENLKISGFKIVDDAKYCDAIILNTCAFIEAAIQESIDTFFDYKNYYTEKPIVVVGCLPSRYDKELEKSLPEASAFLKCNEEDKLAETLTLLGLTPEIDKAKVSDTNPKMRSFAYVKISEGCNRNCSYCMIPKIRGKYKSFNYEEIDRDVNKAQSLGSKEIILVAQDCGVWGKDISSSLYDLLDKLSNKFSDMIFRVLYIQPDAIDDKLLNLIASRKNISKYLDIPLQHCSEKLLCDMNRKGNAKDFLSKIEHIKNVVPECTLRTTFIVGFPGESEDDFEELCDFVSLAQFDYAGCFEYSNEEGSASSKLENQVADEIKYSRTNKLREILDTISLNKLDEKIGNVYPVLIEGKEEGRFYGRAPFQAPEVDGVVFISEYSEEEKIIPGSILNVKIQDSEGYDLVGVVFNG